MTAQAPGAYGTGTLVRIEVTDLAPAGAAAETAAVRLIALLPVGWHATLRECAAGWATLSLTPPAAPAPPAAPPGPGGAAAARAVVDQVLRHPALRGWSRV
ncbi:hypothetical protein [Streptomyces sp. NRRL S-87]|uniref:hypothetical protein n=1 Tax=Streptomyces sp. NRRL S-87 TaxID=1463920 RepID=UPI0004BFEBF6|nr:hypothetical protein [Streptomyces sp. NRRL S-87]